MKPLRPWAHPTDFLDDEVVPISAEFLSRGSDGSRNRLADCHGLFSCVVFKKDNVKIIEFGAYYTTAEAAFRDTNAMVKTGLGAVRPYQGRGLPIRYPTAFAKQVLIRTLPMLRAVHDSRFLSLQPF